MKLGRYISAKLINGYRKLQVAVTRTTDRRNANEVAPEGVDACPVGGDLVVYAKTDGQTEPVKIGTVNKNQLAGSGEIRLYARDSSGAVVFNLWLRASGEILIGDSDSPASYTDFLTKFNDLKVGFDQLRADFNAHTHLYAPGPNPSIATPAPTIPSTASIDTAKATNIKTT